MTAASATATFSTPTANPADLFGQFTAKAFEGLGLWAEANQKVLQNLVDLSTATAIEGVKVYAELQASAVQAVKGGQDVLLGAKGCLNAAQKDPFGMLERTAETVTRSAERLQVSAEHASNRLKTLYTSAQA